MVRVFGRSTPLWGLERFGRLCCDFFRCILLGPGDPDRSLPLGGGWDVFLQPMSQERVVLWGGIDRTLRTTQWTRASSIHTMHEPFGGVVVCLIGRTSILRGGCVSL